MAGITNQISNKPGIIKCGQIVPVNGIHHIRMDAYRHRQKLLVKPPGWNVWNNIEVKEIVEVMKLMAEGKEGEERKIFHKHPHSTWGNYFSGDQIINWLGGNGFGAKMKFRRNQLPG